MSWYSKLSLRTKFVLVTSLLVIAICAGLYFFQDRVIRGYLRSEMQRQAGEIALNLETQIANFADSSQIQDSAQRLLNERREISLNTKQVRKGPDFLGTRRDDSQDLASLRGQEAGWPVRNDVL